MKQVVVRFNRHQGAVIWLMVLAILLVFQAAAVYVCLTTGPAYSLHWQLFREPLTWWMAWSIVLLPVAGIGGVVVAAQSSGRWKLRFAMLLLPVSLLVTMLSAIFWYSLALGNGSGAVVTTTRHGDKNYVLEYAIAGDPPTTRYDLRECSLDGLWCRTVGGVYGYMRSVSAEPATIEHDLDGSYSIAIGGQVRAIVKDGQIECRDTDTLFCTD